jgi:tetratricopeptide (TPR) repeat protein
MLNRARSDTIALELSELEARQFLTAEPFGPAGGYAFRHALIQDAVYGTLLKRDRQQLHGEIAEVIEASAFWAPDEQTEVLAYHYVESTNPAKAIPLLVAAAENAAGRYANETALQHYRRTLALMREYPADYHETLFRVRIGFGQALKFVGQSTEAGQVLEETLQRLQIAMMAPDKWVAITVDVLGELADVRLREGALDTAITHLEAGLNVLGTNGMQTRPELWRSLINRLAFVRLRQGELEKASALASAATADLDVEHVSDPITIASLFGTLGGILCEQGDLAGAIPYVGRSLELYKRLGYSWGMANAYTNLGILYYAQGNWLEAVESFERSHALRREIGYLPGQALNLTNLGLLRMAMGNHAQAQQDLEASLGISRRLGDDYGIVRAKIGLGHLAVIQANFEAAASHMDVACGLLSAAGEDEAIQIRWLLALIRAETGDPQQGLEYATHALQMARAAGLSEQESECLRVLGHIHSAAGAYAEAETHLRDSIDLCRQRNDPYQQGLALLELGRLYQRQIETDKRGDKDWGTLAHTALNGAVKLFKSLGANYDQGLAQEVLSLLPPHMTTQKRLKIIHPS